MAPAEWGFPIVHLWVQLARSPLSKRERCDAGQLLSVVGRLVSVVGRRVCPRSFTGDLRLEFSPSPKARCFVVCLPWPLGLARSAWLPVPHNRLPSAVDRPSVLDPWHPLQPPTLVRVQVFACQRATAMGVHRPAHGKVCIIDWHKRLQPQCNEAATPAPSAMVALFSNNLLPE